MMTTNWRRLLKPLFLILVFLSIADLLTTWVAMTQGNTEVNGIILLGGYLGNIGTLISLLFSKITVIAVVGIYYFFFVRRGKSKDGTFVLAALLLLGDLFYVFVVCSNLYVLLDFLGMVV